MSVYEIKRVIEEMITDIKSFIILDTGKYDFYTEGDEREKALLHAENAFLLYRKINKLKGVNLDLISITKLGEIEHFITDVVKKTDYFKMEDIDKFIEIVNKGGQ